jgi:transposase
MSTKRKQHSPSFKSKIAIMAIKGDFTISEICSKFQVSPSCVHKWKKYVTENLSELFTLIEKNKSSNIAGSGLSENEANGLYAEIGKLKIAKDFLEKKLEG